MHTPVQNNPKVIQVLKQKYDTSTKEIRPTKQTPIQQKQTLQQKPTIEYFNNSRVRFQLLENNLIGQLEDKLVIGLICE